VVVVDEHHHVRFLFLDPLLRPVVAGEHRAPVVVAGLAVVQCGAIAGT